MKPSVWDKLLLIFLCLCVLGMGVLALGMAARFIDPARLGTFLELSRVGFLRSLLFALAALLLFAAAGRVLYAFLLRSRKTVPTPAVTISKGEEGALEISTAAIESIAAQYVGQDQAIRQSNIEVVPAEGGAALRVRAAFAPGTNLAELCVALQDGLKKHLRETCALNVTDVDVMIVPHTAE